MQDKLTKQQEQIRESGELILDENKEKHKIFSAKYYRRN